MKDFYLFPQFSYIIFFFIALNIVYFVGHSFSLFFTQSYKNSAQQIFLKLVLGIIPFMLLPALIYTKGNTIMLGFFIPLLYLLKKYQPKKIGIQKIEKKDFLKLNIIAFPVIFIQLLLFSRLGKWNLLPIDVNNYSEIIFHMKNGFESKYGALNSLFPLNVPKRTPYHYPELWLTASFTYIFPKLKIGYTLIYITYPLLVTIYLKGIISLFTKFKFITQLGLSVTFLFIGVIDLNGFRELFQEGNLLASNTVIFENIGFFFNALPFSYHGQKHLTFYIVALLFFITLKNKNKEEAYIILAFTPILNIGLLPGVLGGLSFILTLDYIKNRKFLSSFKNVFPISLVVLLILLYYKLNGGYDIEKQTSINTLNSSLNIKGEIIKIILKFSYTIFWILIIYGIYLILFFKNKKGISANKNILIFSLASVFIGVCTRPFIEGFNSAQFLTYLLPMINLSLVFLFIYCIESENKWLSLTSIVLSIIVALINFNQTVIHCTTRREIAINKIHDGSFTYKVDSLLTTLQNPRIAYLLSDDDFKTIPPGFWYGYYPCEFLLTKDCFQFYSLNFPNNEYEKNSQLSNNFSPNHLRYIFPHNMSFENYLKELPYFIKKTKINLLVTKTNTTIPTSIKPLISDSIIDTRTGDKIFILLYK